MSRKFSRCKLWSFVTVAVLAAVLLPVGLTKTATAETGDIRTVLYEGLPIDEFLSDGGMAALFGPDTSSQSYLEGRHGNGRYADSFVNDPCLDPAPPGQAATAQSEPEIAVLNAPGSMGKKMVVGYNNSAGFYDRNRGLSGFAYSTDGGGTWIDGGGLPPLVPGSGTADADGKDAYYGDPSVVVDHATQRFFYASIYKLPDGSYTLSVNRGSFRLASAQGVESVANTRCLNDPTQTGVPDPPQQAQERIVWELPVVAVRPTQAVGGVIVDVAQSQDFLDKPWLYVDQTTGTLYLTYTRFALDGETSLELTRCKGCALKGTVTSTDWDGPYTIVPNDPDTLNQGTAAGTAACGRDVVRADLRPGRGRHDRAGRQPDRDATANRVRILGRRRQDVARCQDDRRRQSAAGAARLQPRANLGDRGRAVHRGRQGRGRRRVHLGRDIPDRLRHRVRHLLQREVRPAGPGTAGRHLRQQVDRQRHDVRTAGQGERRSGHDEPRLPDGPGQQERVCLRGLARPPQRSDLHVLTDTWASVSKDNGQSFGGNRIESDVATGWSVRSDAEPNFGDYMSSDLLGFGTFAMVWADGRFRPPGGQAATPDTIFTIAGSLGQ